MLGSADDTNCQKTPTGGSIYNQSRPMIYDHSDIDANLNKIISAQDAERLFNRYVNVICPQFPAVPLPPGTTAQELRKTKPILFLAILSGTSYGAGIPPETQQELEREFRDVIATCIWKTGEKSLQLIQALQVGALWYRPPSNFEQHMFYQMVHMSTIMAIDIGIGRRKSAWKKVSESPERREKAREFLQRVGIPNLEGAEARRAWLVNYYLCITIAMILRRPILLRYNDFMRECLEELESSEGALPSDQLLCQHIHHARVLENIAVQFAMDDPAVNLTLSDGKVSYGIKHHEQALQDLMQRNGSEPSIQLSAHITNLYLHEIALHNHSNVDEFKTPFTEETFKASGSNSVLNDHHVDALLECKNSCMKVISSFLSIDPDIIFVLPVIFCKFHAPAHGQVLTLTAVRMIYAVVVLIKLYISATTPGEIGSVINGKDLHLEESIDSLEAAFQKIVDRDILTPHTKFLYVIQRLGDRYNTIKRQQEDKPDSENATAEKTSPQLKIENIKRSPNSRQTPSSRRTTSPERRHERQAQGLHLLSEAAVSTPIMAQPRMSVPTLTSHTNTPPLSDTSAHHISTPTPPRQMQQSIQQQQQLPQSLAHITHPQPHPSQSQVPHQVPQPHWYAHETAPTTDLSMQGMSGQEMFDDQNQLAGFEVFDFGLGLSMMDGPVTGLFMDNGALWGAGNNEGYFGGGWNP
jgi:hypothetical protein